MIYNPSIDSGPAMDDRAGRGVFGPGGGVHTEAGTARTLQQSDSGKIINFTNAAAVTLTVPAGLGQGFEVGIIQSGAGQVTPTASGTTINNKGGFTKTSGQYAMISLIAVAPDSFVLTGDGA